MLLGVPIYRCFTYFPLVQENMPKFITTCDFDFDIHVVNFPFLDGGIPCRLSYEVYISQPIRFA